MKSMKKLLCIGMISLLAACNGSDQTSSDQVPAIATPNKPQMISYSIVNTYPHDTSSFTQGLVVYNGQMYEGTGDYGHSHLLKTNLETGKIEKKLPLNAKYFGEGITILRDTVYQLTWQQNVVFVYTLNDFKLVKEFPIRSEGWGITTDGKDLIVSDGTSNLYYYDPTTFTQLRTQAITEAGSLAYNLNELEYIEGYIYANQWQAPYILKIDPASGAIVGKIDLTDVWNRVKAKDSSADVPNGIAYDSAAKRIFITGKKWPDLYEIRLGQ